MSELVLHEKTGRVNNVYFAYVKIKNPAVKYQSTDTEYKVDVVVDKNTAKELKKQFPKNTPKEVANEDFEKTYKFEPPFPEQEEQYVFKFATNTHFEKGGELIEKAYNWQGRPKVYVPVDGGVKDVTMDVAVGNGSFGDVAFNVNENKFGRMRNLVGILVKDLIELESNNVSPFGEVVEDEPQEGPDDTDDLDSVF